MKGVHLFKSQITKTIYNDFLTDLKLKKSTFDASPFVYVDPETGTIALLAGSLSGHSGEFDAISVKHSDDTEHRA